MGLIMAGQEVLGYIGEEAAAQATGSKSVSNILPLPLLRFLPLDFFLPWLSPVMHCDVKI